MKIYFATHATTTDNEKGIASGWNNAGLSRQGIQQAEQLRHRFDDKRLGLICCSDLSRAVDTAIMAFADELPIITDSRLREINYGDLNAKPVDIVDPMNAKWIDEPFPNGESYRQAIARTHDFYHELKQNHSEKVVLVVGHRTSRLGLETLAGGRNISDCLSTPFKWQPYWEYNL
jgi:broad specificity phosphatase PhoE